MGMRTLVAGIVLGVLLCIGIAAYLVFSAEVAIHRARLKW